MANNEGGNEATLRENEAKFFARHMEDWLDWAWTHCHHPMFLTLQTEQFGLGKKNITRNKESKKQPVMAGTIYSANDHQTRRIINRDRVGDSKVGNTERQSNVNGGGSGVGISFKNTKHQKADGRDFRPINTYLLYQMWRAERRPVIGINGGTSKSGHPIRRIFMTYQEATMEFKALLDYMADVHFQTPPNWDWEPHSSQPWIAFPSQTILQSEEE